MSSLYEKIVSREIPSYIVFEDEQYIAFLTPFANTPGHTVVTTKVNPGDNIFEIENETYLGLMSAAKIVAGKIKQAFKIDKVGLVIDGSGVPHAHVQLVPLHGYKEGQDVAGVDSEFNDTYPGYISSVNGPQMDKSMLEEIQKRIMQA